MHVTTIDPAVKWLVLDRLLDAHPDLSDEAHLLAAAETRSVDTPTIALQVERALLALPFTRIADRAGRRDGGYVDETEAGWSLITEALHPLTRSAVRLGQKGHVLAARQVALGVIIGAHRRVHPARARCSASGSAARRSRTTSSKTSPATSSMWASCCPRRTARLAGSPPTPGIRPSASGSCGASRDGSAARRYGPSIADLARVLTDSGLCAYRRLGLSSGSSQDRRCDSASSMLRKRRTPRGARRVTPIAAVSS